MTFSARFAALADKRHGRQNFANFTTINTLRKPQTAAVAARNRTQSLQNTLRQVGKRLFATAI